MSFDLNNAITKHAEWKSRLKAAISHKETLDTQLISRDDCCEIGKWLHGNGKLECGHLPAYDECVQAHAAFHTEAGRVAEAINQGRYDEATAMLAQGTSYTTASNRVAFAITKLESIAA